MLDPARNGRGPERRMTVSADRFHIGVVLSITSDRLVSPGGFADFQRALSYMAGEDVFTHQIPRVMDEARPAILAKYPLLARVVVPDDINEATVAVWLDKQAKLYGEFLTLPRLTTGQHERIDPESEAVEKLHPSKIKTVTMPRRSN